MSFCRGIRGATTTPDNTMEAIFDATQELFQQMVAANEIVEDDVAAVFLTATQDLDAAFPATAVRNLGWDKTALLCSTEIAVPYSLSKFIRILILVNTDKRPDDMVHVYLRDAVNLRIYSEQG